jgi:hypothetical protein
MNLIAQTTQPVSWLTPELLTALVALIGAIAAAVVGVIGALRGTHAVAQSASNSDRLTSQSVRMNAIEGDQKRMALHLPSPSVNRPPTPLLLLPLLLIPFIVGCAGPDPAFVAAERKTHDAIAPEFLEYSKADPNKDAQEKAIDQRLIEQWDRDLDQVESELKGGK